MWGKTRHRARWFRPKWDKELSGHYVGYIRAQIILLPEAWNETRASLK